MDKSGKKTKKTKKNSLFRQNLRSTLSLARRDDDVVHGAPFHFARWKKHRARYLKPQMRWLGLGRKAGAAPYVAIGVGVISGNFIFAEPIREHFAAKGAGVAAQGAAAVGETGKKK